MPEVWLYGVDSDQWARVVGVSALELERGVLDAIRATELIGDAHQQGVVQAAVGDD